MFHKILVLLFLQYVLVSSVSFRQGLLPVEICETKECHDAADHIKKWMNPAFEPCEDFYEYSCGYWHNPENTTENKLYNSSLGSRDTIMNFHLKNFLLDDEIDEESRLFQTLRKFLSVCLDEESIEARGVAPAVEALRKAGGWPVLEESWSEDNWKLEDAEIAFGGGAFFRIYLADDDKWILQIRPMSFGQFILPGDLIKGFENETVKEYYNMKCGLVEAFGGEKSQAEQDMRDALEFEIAVVEAVMGRNASSDSNMTLSELEDTISWVNWTYLLSGVLPESVTIAKNDTIDVRCMDLLKDLGTIISKYPKRTVANYVMWVAAVSLTDYLPLKVRRITEDNDTLNKTRHEQCFTFLEKSSLSGVVASYIARQTVEDMKTATEMTQNILNELLQEIEELEWLDEKTRTAALNTLRETKILISFPQEVLDVDMLEDIYKEVTMNTSYLFEAMMDSNKWVREEIFEKIGKDTTDITLQERIYSSLTINAYFRLGANTIVITGGFLHFIPLFSSKVPAYVNYGHLGGIVAHELTHALDFQTDKSDTDKYAAEDLAEHLMERWGSNETEGIYDEKKQCIIDQYCSFNDTKYTKQMLNGNQTDREDVADNGGFKLALRAYRRMAAKLAAPEPRLPTLQQYTPEQLFILSLANAYCEVPQIEKLKGQILYDSHSPFEFRIKGMMMNSPDFSKLFHCKPSDPMNPANKCEVW